MSKPTVIGGVVAVLLAVAYASAQQPAKFTAQDYADIYALYGKSNFVFDKVSENGAAWADLFAADGVYIDMEGNRVVGREKLIEYVWQKGPTNVTSYTTNLVFAPVAEGAIAKSYLATASWPIGGASILQASGIIFDLLVKTPQGWRIKQRNVLKAGVPVPDSVPEALKRAVLR